MDMFTCKCGYSTNRKSNLDTHQKRKTRNDKCIPIDEIVVQLAKNDGGGVTSWFCGGSGSTSPPSVTESSLFRAFFSRISSAFLFSIKGT